MIANDKMLHIATGALISLAVTPLSNPIAGFCAALLAGCAKEWIWDAWLGRGDFDPWDAVATTAGGIGVSLIFVATRV